MTVQQIETLLEMQIEINCNNNIMIENISDILKIQTNRIHELEKKVQKLDGIIVGMTINN